MSRVIYDFDLLSKDNQLYVKHNSDLDRLDHMDILHLSTFSIVRFGTSFFCVLDPTWKSRVDSSKQLLNITCIQNTQYSRQDLLLLLYIIGSGLYPKLESLDSLNEFKKTNKESYSKILDQLAVYESSWLNTNVKDAEYGFPGLVAMYLGYDTARKIGTLEEV